MEKDRDACAEVGVFSSGLRRKKQTKHHYLLLVEGVGITDQQRWPSRAQGKALGSGSAACIPSPEMSQFPHRPPLWTSHHTAVSPTAVSRSG